MSDPKTRSEARTGIHYKIKDNKLGEIKTYYEYGPLRNSMTITDNMI